MTPTAQMKALMTLAIWNVDCFMPNMPAASGMTPRMGPKKWPRKTPAKPYLAKKRSPRGIRRGCVRKGQMSRTVSLK